MEGYLSKRSDHLKRWNKRYFKLEGSKLSYHDDSSAASARGSWEIDGSCSFSEVADKSQMYAFTLTIGGKAIYLAADDESARQKWRDAVAVPMGTADSGASAASSNATKPKYSSSSRSFARGGSRKAPSSCFMGSDTRSYRATGEGLRDAIKHNNFDACRKILQEKKHLAQYIDNSNNTVLHLAVLFNYKNIAQLLVECGADVNAENKRKETPISIAKPVMKKYLAQWAAKA